MTVSNVVRYFLVLWIQISDRQVDFQRHSPILEEKSLWSYPLLWVKERNDENTKSVS